MTDLELDQILEQTREVEPIDDAFVASVMQEVRTDEQRRRRMRLVRRPLVFGVAAAALATSGAVAALVGTHAPSHISAASQSPGAAQVTVTFAPSASAGGVASPSVSAPGSPAASAAATRANGQNWGFPTPHTAYVVDDRTGMKLTTETYTNDFRSGRAQRVTLTILNTSSDPVAISGLNGCALEVIATPAAGAALAPQCATGGVSNHRVVLAPGGFYKANASLTLPTNGIWSVVGECQCAYTQPTKPQPQVSNAPIGSLLGAGSPPPQLPTTNAPAANVPATGIARLATPPITIQTSG